MAGIIGRKLGMTQIFDANGTVTPVTVIEAGPCPVLQVREAKQGHAVQLGFGAQKSKGTNRASLPEAGHAKKAGLDAAPRVLKEFAFGTDGAPAIGDQVTVGAFQQGERIKVTGFTKGRGFQGVMKRHGFGGGRASHGATRVHRAPGSIGAGTNPSRVIKGKRMPGHMGTEKQTIRNLQVVKIDGDRNLLYVRGAVPGSINSIVFVTQGSR